jgi:hypothetical protein
MRRSATGTYAPSETGAPVFRGERLITRAWSITEWVAVMAVAPDPEELTADVERLVDLCPDQAVLAKIHAHEGLAEALGVEPEWWFCGVAVGERGSLEAVDARLGTAFGRPPLLLGSFRLLRLVD